MVQPLHSTPITGTSSLLWAGPNAGPATVLNASRVPPACARSLSPPTGGSVGASPPTFHVKAADRARVAYMPGTAWPVTGSPPDLSWSLVPAPVSMPPKTNFDTSAAIRLRSPSRSPPDASCAPFPTRSRQRSSANAAVGGLTPLPEERPRRATTFIFHAAAQSIEVSYLHSNLSLLRAWHTHDQGLARATVRVGADRPRVACGGGGRAEQRVDIGRPGGRVRAC
jgi:hypothetical protein